MPITPVPLPPLRTQGKTGAQFSAEFEAFSLAYHQSVIDFNAAASAYQLSVTNTSTTSNTVGTGSRTFTVLAGSGYYIGMPVRAANSATNHMTGEVTSYSGTTLVCNMTASAGTGTFTSWVIGPVAVGANSAGSVSFAPAGNISATNVQAAIVELDNEKLSSAAGAVTNTNLNSITTADTTGSSFLIPVVTKDVKGRVPTTTTAPKIVSGTLINTTSGLAHEFLSIPAAAKKITLMLNGVSTNGTDNLIVQLGSGTYQTTGYSGCADNQSSSGGITASFTAGLGLERISTAANARHGIVTFVNISGNTWIGTYIGSTTAGTNTVAFASTSVTLAGALDRIRITSSAGANTFDAGSINILIE